MKKRIVCMLLILSMVFSLASCDFLFPDNSDPNAGSGSPDTGKTDGENDISGSEKIINVYLIAGQSNAVGYGMDTGAVIAGSDERFVNGFDNVLYYGSQERWSGAYPNNVFEPLKLNMGVDSNRSGAEIGIAAAVADNGEMNAIIKCAWGATHLYPDTNYDISLKQGTWTSPTYIKNNNIDTSKNPLIGNMYNRFEETVKKGIQLLIEDGYTPVIKGVWWMQGEAEMFTLEMASEYKELYETLIFDTRNMLGNVTGYDCGSVPFVCGLPKWNTQNSAAPAYQGMVRTAMMTVADELDNVGYVDCMPLNQHDDWHFDAAGQKYLGENFVAKVREFEEIDEALTGDRVSIENEIKLLVSETGLEFRANLTGYNSADGNEYGFILVPTAKLDENAIYGDYFKAFDELYISHQTIPAEVVIEQMDENYSDIYLTCRITDVLYENLNTEYTAIAYIKNQYGSYTYSGRGASASVAGLASRELYSDTENNEAILAILNSAINFAGGVSFENRNQPNTLELITEESIQLSFSQATGEYTMTVDKSVTVDFLVKFTSENPEIVSVDENGVLTPHKIGETFITVECAGKSKQVAVSVGSFTKDGVALDGVISEGEYVGEVISATNGTLSVKFSGMTKNSNLYMSFELTHGEWSPFSGSWWLNDNIEFKLSDGISHTVVFYEGVPTYSSNISYGVSQTEEIGGKLVTTVEICVENVPEAQHIKVGFNGTNFGWLGAIWNNELNLAYVTGEGIVSETPISVGNGLVLDGVFSEEIYTENVKNSVVSANANGAGVDIIGTLTESGVVFGVTVNHTKAVDVNTTTPYDWFTFMNIEFHFNGSGTQFIAIAHNRNSLGQIFTYCNTVSEGSGYISTFEIFIPYEAIGAADGTESINFTARGWFETGWCDLLNTSWNATHTVTSDGISSIR